MRDNQGQKTGSSLNVINVLVVMISTGLSTGPTTSGGARVVFLFAQMGQVAAEREQEERQKERNFRSGNGLAHWT